MIHSLAKKRNLYLKAQQVMQNLASGDDVEAVKSDLSTFLNGDVDVSSNTTKKIDEVLNPTLDSILSVKENGGIAGITTGFKTIDKYIGGLLKGSLTIIGARPAMGKTAFALNMAEESAKRTNKPVLIISLEMNNEMLVKRMFAKESNISSEKIRDGNLDENEIGRLTFASEKMSELPIWFDDTPIQSFDDIRSRVLRLQRQQGELGMVMIDYLGLIETGNERNSNRVNEVSKISRGLKVLSKEVDAPIVALAQLNRGVEQRTDKRPLLSDLRDSGSIEQDADNVAFLYRDDYYRNEGEEQPDDDEISTVEFIIAKNRNGKRGTIQLAFNKKYSMMTDWVNESQGSTVW
ncbi:replicative DNA helicase [Leuconostoc mesenteroides]|jgi:replicative DNA helicase|uniref:replicative DNA helicase n=1 Tax=Leuconostoc mesenteroides TaxID=1245 RepID=UPI0023622694|nr:replicative DNA helicase [Leuconostoc mesenteroides]MCH3951986.1 replicative DNA helicase [Leuconostoc mesenteroides]